MRERDVGQYGDRYDGGKLKREARLRVLEADVVTQEVVAIANALEERGGFVAREAGVARVLQGSHSMIRGST